MDIVIVKLKVSYIKFVFLIVMYLGVSSLISLVNIYQSLSI